MTVHTHYDNLKVTRKAPLEVIRAAYRAMAQKYHPDVNSSRGASDVMRLLNEAWEVLGDPVKRAAHDRWIAEQEAAETKGKPGAPAPASAETWTEGTRTYSYHRERPFGYSPPQGQAKAHPGAANAESSDAFKAPRGRAFTVDESLARQVKRPTWTLKRTGIGVGILAACWLFTGGGGAAWVVSQLTASRHTAPTAPANPIEASVPPAGEPNYARCAGSYEPEKCRRAEQLLAAETPEQASRRREGLARATERNRELAQRAPDVARPEPAYVPFTGKLDFAENPALLEGPSRHVGSVRAQGGLSVISIDNTAGDSDTEVRLYRDGKKPHVRSMLVRKGTSFSSTGIAPGSYAVRWRTLGSPNVFEANERALLEEEDTEQGRRYSQVSFTLYKVRNGNLRTSRVAENEF